MNENECATPRFLWVCNEDYMPTRGEFFDYPKIGTIGYIDPLHLYHYDDGSFKGFSTIKGTCYCGGGGRGYADYL